jgi:adenylate cyclase
MFTDMVGYSALTQDDEEAAIRALEAHNRTLRPVFARFHGREVKTIGDAFLIEFDSALDAVRCAMEMQEQLEKASIPSGWDRPVQIRIGIHVGDVVESNGDVFGDAVNIASRIEPLATPGGICLSQQVFDQVENKISATFVKLPPVELKNIRAPTGVYRILGKSAPRVTPKSVRKAPEQQHLAVLPLVNIGHDPEDEYFADGLTEELITVLSQIRGLAVIARTSVMPYKTEPKPIAEVGAELGVDVVLEGSVRKSGNRVRVSLQLVNAATQRHLWAGTVNRELDDVFEAQSYVASRAARALRLTLNKSRRLSPRTPPPPNPRWGIVTAGDAYDSYLRGLAAASDLGETGPEEAFRWFERATRLDPGLSDAYASWSNLYVVAAGDFFPMREGMPRAKELAAKALALDPHSSIAHAALGNIALQFDNDWTLAESEFRSALELNPSNVTAYQFYALLLMSLDRVEEAKQMMRQALRLDPAGHHRHPLAWAELESGNVDTAIEYLSEGRSHDPHPRHHAIMRGLFYLTAGRRAEARREADAADPPSNEDERFDLGLLNAMLGRPEQARGVLRDIEAGTFQSYTNRAHVAMMWGALGDREQALRLLEEDLRDGDHVLWLHYRAIFYDSIRDDPRFVAMMREMQLPIHPIRSWRKVVRP